MVTEKLLFTQDALCSRFGVTHYPTIRLGKPAAYVKGSEAMLANYSGPKEAEPLIEWVGQQQSV